MKRMVKPSSAYILSASAKVMWKKGTDANDAFPRKDALLFSADTSKVNSRYLDFGYLEKPLISKRKSGPCFNTEI